MIESLLFRPLGPVGPLNFLKHAIQQAAISGVPTQTIVILLLFPLVACLIAGARHFIGIRGFGIFTPAMLSVAFLAMGVFNGVVLFVIILVVANLARMAMKGLKIHYLARMSMLLWFICLGVFVSLFWLRVSIFPILILILLAENFIEVQISKSLREAGQLTLETFILALGSLGVLSWGWLQKELILHPEAIVLGTAGLNIIIGRFTGLRLLEYRRFRRLLK
jgi:hypothetical protein